MADSGLETCTQNVTNEWNRIEQDTNMAVAEIISQKELRYLNWWVILP